MAQQPRTSEVYQDKIVIRAVSSLKVNPRNARTHSPKQVRQIADSIAAFGFTNPVLIDGQGMVLAGHGRVAAARRLGREAVPTLELDWLSPAEKRAYVIADNRLAETAGWDKELLAIELNALIELDGVQPKNLSGRKLTRISNLPLCWSEQRRMLGFR